MEGPYVIRRVQDLPGDICVRVKLSKDVSTTTRAVAAGRANLDGFIDSIYHGLGLVHDPSEQVHDTVPIWGCCCWVCRVLMDLRGEVPQLHNKQACFITPFITECQISFYSNMKLDHVTSGGAGTAIYVGHSRIDPVTPRF